MSAVGFLLGLLVLSYLGSILIGGRALRGFGLPSGVEYLVIGFVLGPQALSVVSRSLVTTFEPLVICGVGWLGLVVGTSYLPLGREQLRPRRLLLGLGSSLFVAAACAGAVWGAAVGLDLFQGKQALVLALCCGMVCAETTRHSVRWVAERYGARGALSELLLDFACVSFVALALTHGAVSALTADSGLPFLPSLGRFGVTVGLGLVLGGTAALLLGREVRRAESWALLLGTTFLGMGAAATLNLSPFTAMAVMGLTLALGSRHRSEIRAMVAPTEKPVLLPLLLLSGASIELHVTTAMVLLGGVALLAKLAARLAVGGFSGLVVPAARGRGGLLGLGMMSAGGITVATALGFSVRNPGEIGNAVLLLAAVVIIVGEALGPIALRRALGEAHELRDGALAPAQESGSEA